MKSIAQIIIDKYNGIETIDPDAEEQKRLQLQEELRTAYKNALKVGVWVVEFTKVNGTPAVMECTLDSKLVPFDSAKLSPMPGPVEDRQEHLIHAWSVDRFGWRSFKVLNVTKFYKKPEEL